MPRKNVHIVFFGQIASSDAREKKGEGKCVGHIRVSVISALHFVKLSHEKSPEQPTVSEQKEGVLQRRLCRDLLENAVVTKI